MKKNRSGHRVPSGGALAGLWRVQVEGITEQLRVHGGRRVEPLFPALHGDEHGGKPADELDFRRGEFEQVGGELALSPAGVDAGALDLFSGWRVWHGAPVLSAVWRFRR